jgi:hypothetical protein
MHANMCYTNVLMWENIETAAAKGTCSSMGFYIGIVSKINASCVTAILNA